MMTWWCDKGVDGFRMDTISMISKTPEMPDGELRPGSDFGDFGPYVYNGPNVHKYLREMREKVLRHYDLLTVGEAEWDDMHQSNLRGAFFCAQAAANQMIRQGTGGAIVNILSINAFRPMADGLVYGSSKAGLEMVTRCMAFELGKYGIRVNAVAPGLIDAPGLDQNVPGWRERYSDRAPLGRIAQHVDIADVCIFCCSELSAWVTGETILADGGVMLAEAY